MVWGVFYNSIVSIHHVLLLILCCRKFYIKKNNVSIHHVLLLILENITPTLIIIIQTSIYINIFKSFLPSNIKKIKTLQKIIKPLILSIFF